LRSGVFLNQLRGLAVVRTMGFGPGQARADATSETRRQDDGEKRHRGDVQARSTASQEADGEKGHRQISSQAAQRAKPLTCRLATCRYANAVTSLAPLRSAPLRCAALALTLGTNSLTLSTSPLISLISSLHLSSPSRTPRTASSTSSTATLTLSRSPSSPACSASSAARRGAARPRRTAP
jgi:hypothetical protein